MTSRALASIDARRQQPESRYLHRHHPDVGCETHPAVLRKRCGRRFVGRVHLTKIGWKTVNRSPHRSYCPKCHLAGCPHCVDHVWNGFHFVPVEKPPASMRSGDRMRFKRQTGSFRALRAQKNSSP